MFVNTTDLTPGIARSSTRSRAVVEVASAGLPTPVTWTRTISSSTRPVSRSMRARRSRIKNTALQTIAQVNAIWSTISAAAVRCLRSVERMGTKCMVASVGLELGGRRDLAAAPRRKQAREDAADDREHERQSEHRHVERRELGVVDRLVADGPEAEVRKAEPEQAAGEPDDAGLDEELHEDRSLRCPERAAHADLRGAAQELREQEPDGVDQTHEQEREREQGLQPRVLRDHLLDVEPLANVVEPDVRRSLEAPGGALLVRVVEEIAPVRLRLLLAVELDPVLDPLACRVEAVLIVLLVAVATPAV